MHYRLYRLQETTGSIVDAADILAETDDEAIRAGREAYVGAPIEIWCRTRRIFSTQPPTSHARTSHVI